MCSPLGVSSKGVCYMKNRKSKAEQHALRCKFFDHVITIAQRDFTRKDRDAVKAGYSLLLARQKSENRKHFRIANELKELFPQIHASLLLAKNRILKTTSGGISLRAWFLFGLGRYPKCTFCGKPTVNIYKETINYDTPIFCNGTCASRYACLIMEKIALEKYGVSNIFASDEFKKNRVKYYQEKYGENVTAPLLVPGAKEKVEQTSLERYGYTHFSRSPIIKERVRRGLVKKNGENYSQVLRKKGRKTLKKHYGRKAKPNERKEIRQNLRDNKVRRICVKNTKLSNLSKFGVEHCMQLHEYFEYRLKKSARTKIAIFKGIPVQCQGFEKEAIEFLSKWKNVKFVATERKYVPKVAYEFDGKKKIYYPDLFIKFNNGQQAIIEVKSTYSLNASPEILRKNLCKFKTAQKYFASLGMKFAVMIVDKINNSVRVTSQKFTKTNLVTANDSHFVGKVYSLNVS